MKKTTEEKHGYFPRQLRRKQWSLMPPLVLIIGLGTIARTTPAGLPREAGQEAMVLSEAADIHARENRPVHENLTDSEE